MSVRNGIALLLALSTLSLLVGCGSGSPTAVAPPTGGFSTTNLSGTYVFSVSGVDSAGNFFTAAGSLTANGSSSSPQITAGTLDLNDPENGGDFPGLTVGSGPYSVTPDGRGTASLSTSQGTIKLDFVLTSSSHGLVTRFDNGGTGSGTLDLQTTITQSQLAGSYAFTLAGVDTTDTTAYATAGAFTLDQNGNVITGVQDFNDGGFTYTALPVSGSVVLGTGSAPGTATLTTETFGTLTFDVYAIDNTHLKFVETDIAPALSGDVFTQTGASIPTGPMVFTVAGLDSSGTVAAGGLMTSDGTGNFTGGLEDVNDDGDLSPAQLLFTGTAAAGGSIGGRVIVNLSGFDPAIQYVIYPSSGGVLMLETDGLAITTGAAFAQTSTSISASQGYGLNLTGTNIADGVEVDDIAEFSTTSSGISGIIDENYEPSGATNSDRTLTGTYTPDSPATGRGSIVVPSVNTLNGVLDLEYYVVSSSTILVVEGDNTQVATGSFGLQNAPSGGAALLHVAASRPGARLHGALRKQK